MLAIGKKAPAFSVEDQDGDTVKLKDLEDKWAVVYFYPKDMTPGCTTESCDFRDNLARIKRAGARVFGVSADSTKSHRKFIDKHDLNFPLLSDPEHGMLETWGVWQKKKNYGREYMGIVRTTVILDPQGKVREIWSPVKVKGHVDEVLERLKELKKAAK